MRSSLDYAGFAQLCGKSPIMRKIMRAHNRIIPRSLVYVIFREQSGQAGVEKGAMLTRIFFASGGKGEIFFENLTTKRCILKYV